MKKLGKLFLGCISVFLFMTALFGCVGEQEKINMALLEDEEDECIIQGSIENTTYTAYSYLTSIENYDYRAIVNSVDALQALDETHGGVFFREDSDYYDEAVSRRIRRYDDGFFSEKQLVIVAKTLPQQRMRIFGSLELDRGEFLVTILKALFDEDGAVDGTTTYVYVIEADKNIKATNVVIKTKTSYGEDEWQRHINYDSYAPIQKDQTTITLPNGQTAACDYSVYMEFLPRRNACLIRTYEEFLDFFKYEERLGEIVFDSLKDEYTETFFETKCLVFFGIRHAASNMPVTSVRIHNDVIESSVLIDYRLDENTLVWDVQGKFTLFIEIDKEYVTPDTTVKEPSCSFGVAERDTIINRRVSYSGRPVNDAEYER